MITTGQELYTLMGSLNGDADLDITLAETLVATAKSMIEEERPWMVLRKTDTSLSVSTSDTWQTAKSIAGITDFSSFHTEYPVRVFDGGNMISYYQQTPFDRRLEHKDNSGTFTYDAANKNIYFNGIHAFNGTVYLNYLSTSPDISLTSDAAVWTPFPARFLPLLAFYAVQVHKGAVDYDDVNARMLEPHNQVYQALHDAMTKWDEKLALSELEHNDPTNLYNIPRLGTVDRSA